jgi:hypothetical protein
MFAKSNPQIAVVTLEFMIKILENDTRTKNMDRIFSIGV